MSQMIVTVSLGSPADDEVRVGEAVGVVIMSKLPAWHQHTLSYHWDHTNKFLIIYPDSRVLPLT